MSETLISKPDFVSKLLRSKKFRDSYAYELVRTGIPFQMRALRDQRDWTQADLAQAAEKPRSVITRLESPSYGKLSLKSLFEIASAFEVALMVKFVPFSRLVREYQDVSTQSLIAKKITDRSEIAALEAWASEPAFVGGTTPFVVSGPGTGKAAMFVSALRGETVPLTLDDLGPKPYVIARGVHQEGTQIAIVAFKKPKAA